MIWVVGARGMLGRDVVRELDALGLAHVDSDLDCDIADAAAVERFAQAQPLDWILNCAAYTAVDAAEDNEAAAEAVNARGSQNLARLATQRGARLIHVSTDYVFDGEASSPYAEDGTPAPRGAYGRSKLHGERLLAEACAQHFVVRTAWLYGLHGKNFVATMLRLMNEREVVSVVDDQRGTPTYTRDLAAALCRFVTTDAQAYGIYHYTNDGEATWFEFARAVLELGRTRGLVVKDCELRPITTAEYPTRAIRPRYSVLSKAKLRRALGLDIPTWEDALARYFDELLARPGSR
jgi:dTDP-4-dehydrorhamnose reductase